MTKLKIIGILYESLETSDTQGFHPMVRYRSPKPLMGVRIPQPLLYKRAVNQGFPRNRESFFVVRRDKFLIKKRSPEVTKEVTNFGALIE